MYLNHFSLELRLSCLASCFSNAANNALTDPKAVCSVYCLKYMQLAIQIDRVDLNPLVAVFIPVVQEKVLPTRLPLKNLTFAKIPFVDT